MKTEAMYYPHSNEKMVAVATFITPDEFEALAPAAKGELVLEQGRIAQRFVGATKTVKMAHPEWRTHADAISRVYFVEDK